MNKGQLKPAIYISIILFCLFLGRAQAQSVEVLKFEEFESIIKEPSDKARVINFWATWCKPCIKEIPYFESANEQFGDKIEVILVSLDFANELESKLIPYIKRKGMGSRIMLMDDVDYNSWINLVDPSWSGAIPATLIISKDGKTRKFYEGELEEEELLVMLKPYIL